MHHLESGVYYLVWCGSSAERMALFRASNACSYTCPSPFKECAESLESAFSLEDSFTSLYNGEWQITEGFADVSCQLNGCFLRGFIC